MAYEVLQERVLWGGRTDPSIYLSFYVDHYRDGDLQYYRVKFVVEPTTGTAYFGYPVNLALTVNGATIEAGANVKPAAPAGPSTWVEPYVYESDLIWVRDATDVSAAVFRVYSGAGSSRDYSYAYSLPFDPPAATISTAAAGTLGTAQKITVNGADGRKVTIVAQSGSRSQTIVSNQAVSSVNWTPSKAFANNVPNSLQVSIRVTCTTWDASGAAVGSNYVDVTCALPADIVPTVSAVTVSDAAGIANTYGSYLTQYSSLRIRTTAAGVYGSTISSVSVVVDNVGSFPGTDVTTGTLTRAGTINITVTATDSRGRKATKTTSVSVVEYVAPYLTSISVTRATSSGAVSPSGNYGRVTFSARVMALNNHNTATYSYLYRVKGSASWTEVAIPDLAGQYTVNKAVVTFPAATGKSYEIAIKIQDKFRAPVSTIIVLSTVYVLAQATASGDGISLGKLAERPGLDIGLQAIFHGGIGGDTLPASADFNTLMTVGKYLPGSNANFRTMANRPCDNSGFLWVTSPQYPEMTTLTGNSKDVLQIFVSYDPHIYIRGIHTDSGGAITFDAWKTII